MAKAKSLKARFKSIQNTRKITKAMEMVAASKMKRVIDRALKTREYTQTAWEILTKTTSSIDIQNPLLDIRKVERICIVMITSNKGLCGGLNSQLVKKVFENVESPYNMMINRTRGIKILPDSNKSDLDVDFISIGKKGRDEIVKAKKNLVASFTDLNDQSGILDLKPVAKMIIDGYEAKKYDKVIVAYTDFISTVVSKPRLRQVLPISTKDLERQLEELGKGIAYESEMDEVKEDVYNRYYTFEPDAEKILEKILPQVVESQIYQAFLESQASEFSARMITMKNASDTAKEMLESLNFQYNQARQAAITAELAEISAGMAVL
ncbi:MAG: ATP synthase F1 subunit gamma [Candidatus Moranbacteria bacterium]|nr:ATP synthase F1 subunit gamma [Candidatus Moranbacteria bacterium]